MSTASDEVSRLFIELAAIFKAGIVPQEEEQITVEALATRLAQLEASHQRLSNVVTNPAPVREFTVEPDTQLQYALSWAATYKRNLEHLQKASRTLIASWDNGPFDFDTFRKEYETSTAMPKWEDEKKSAI